MTESLVLTFAELSALCGLTESAQATNALDLLKVSADARTDLVRQAGLASLLARDLARVEADNVVLASGPEMIFDSLTGARSCVEVGVITEQGVEGFVLFDGPGARVLIAPRAHATYSVLGLDPAADLAEQLGEIIGFSLAEHTDAVAAVVAADPQPDPLRSVVIGISEGRWHFAATGSDGPREFGSRDEVVARLVDQLRVLTTE